MPSFGKVAVVGIVGNEDGAHHVTAELLQALNDTGWTIPAQAACYWVGEAMHKTDFKDLPKVPDNVQGLAGILASNAAHLANLLQAASLSGSAQAKVKAALDPIPAACGSSLAERLGAARRLTLALAAPLSDADATIQPFPDASPAKWHLAHTSWFFETFVLRDHVAGYRPFDERWAFLFNSYYEAEGPRHARPRRGMLSRPSLDEVRAYRAHVDEALDGRCPTFLPRRWR